MSKKDSSPKKPLRTAAIFMGMGAEMGVTIFLSNYLGQWLDEKYQTTNLEDIATMGGVFIAMTLVIYRVNRFNKK